MLEMGTLSQVRQLDVKYIAQGHKGARSPVGFEPTTIGLRVKR